MSTSKHDNCFKYLNILKVCLQQREGERVGGREGERETQRGRERNGEGETVTKERGRGEKREGQTERTTEERDIVKVCLSQKKWA